MVTILEEELIWSLWSLGDNCSGRCHTVLLPRQLLTLLFGC